MTYPQDSLCATGAIVAAVQPGSPAAQAGLKAGQQVVTAEGEALRDILDWYWLSAEDSLTLAYRQPTPDARLQHVTLTRRPGEAWGIEFNGALFNGLKCCINNCVFCFMRMLPPQMRPTLYNRDDDFRLSFLQGNFVTLTNVSEADELRIIEQRLSPLNVSLHAVDPAVRKELIGRHHARGLEVLEHLLAAGIECKAQIVLLPGLNDGAVLAQTLNWIAARPGITSTALVPYGYTKHARLQRGFDTPESARAVIQQVGSLAPRVQLADEFFLRAFPERLLEHLPPASYYDGYALLEDGVGMVRQYVDEWREQEKTLSEDGLFVTGTAFARVLQELVPQCAGQIVPVRNRFFGGNVDVAGLLTASDLMAQAHYLTEAACHHQRCLYLPPSMFNSDGLTLDDKTADDIAHALGCPVKVQAL